MAFLSHEITSDEINEYTKYPLTLTFTVSEDASPEIKLYKNNKLLDSKQLGSKTTLNYIDYSLINILSEDEEPYDKKIVEDIIGIKGELKENSLYYLNTILNTNF